MNDEETTNDLPFGLDLASLKAQALDLLEKILTWLKSPAFYAQIGLIAGALVLASLSARLIRGYLPEHARYKYLLNLPEEEDVDQALKNAPVHGVAGVTGVYKLADNRPAATLNKLMHLV